MPELTDNDQVYIPSTAESEEMLDQVETWVKRLKALNVNADIAVYIARDFISPMRIEAPKLVLADKASGGPPNRETHAVSGRVYEPIEEIEVEGRRKRV